MRDKAILVKYRYFIGAASYSNIGHWYESVLLLRNSFYAPGAKNVPASGVTVAYIKSTFSEYDHVA